MIRFSSGGQVYITAKEMELILEISASDMVITDSDKNGQAKIDVMDKILSCGKMEKSDDVGR